MKNKNRKINLYTQGQRFAARVLFIVWLLVSAPGSALAVSSNNQATASASTEGEISIEKVKAIIQLGTKNPEPLTSASLEVLQEAATTSQNSNVRHAAVQGIGQLLKKLDAEGHKQSLTALEQVIIGTDKDGKYSEWTVRKAAVEAYTKFVLLQQASLKTFCSVAFLSKEIKDTPVITVFADVIQKDIDSRVEVLKQVAKTDPNCDVRKAEAATTNDDWQVREVAVEGIGEFFGQLKDTKKRDELLAFLQQRTLQEQEKDWQVRKAAVWTFKELAKQRDEKLNSLERATALEVLINATKDQDRQVRKAAVKALGKIGAQLQGDELHKVLDALQKAIQDQDWQVREAAVEALGTLFKNRKVKDSESVQLALKARDDIDISVRNAASYALLSIRVSELEPAALEVLRNAKNNTEAGHYESSMTAKVVLAKLDEAPST